MDLERAAGRYLDAGVRIFPGARLAVPIVVLLEIVCQSTISEGKNNCTYLNTDFNGLGDTITVIPVVAICIALDGVVDLAIAFRPKFLFAETLR